jgi:DNA topoisomerase-3
LERVLKTVVVAEKPSVARDIAAALGGYKSQKGFFITEHHYVTWAVGHLIALGEPHQIDPRWRKWSLPDLPLLPSYWPLFVIEKTAEQADIIKNLLHREDVKDIICATDAGREGELIFRYIYEFSGCKKPFKRLWISTLTTAAIRDGLQSLRRGSEFDGLADSAKARNRADWLVGMNLSRAYSLRCKGEFSVGRVQTPTLAILVERELEIRNFVVEPYCEIHGAFKFADGTSYEGSLAKLIDGSRHKLDAKTISALTALRFEGDGVAAGQTVDAIRAGERPVVVALQSRNNRLSPPLLFDLTELQRQANRLYGFSAEKTLGLAQSLYEKYKLISYPRTDSRYLTTEVAKTLGPIVTMLREERYGDLALSDETGQAALSARYVDNGKVNDHHALIPTPVSPRKVKLTDELEKIYDLVARRLLALWQGDYVSATTLAVTQVLFADNKVQKSAFFITRGTQVLSPGFKAVDAGAGVQAEVLIPKAVQKGADPNIDALNIVNKKTRPPAHFTDASLLTAMETAGKMLSDDEFPDVMKDFGIGTPATRAVILESLIQRGYLVRQGKQLHPTAKGMQLIERVHADVKSPALTGIWESKLKKIAQGTIPLDDFMQDISSFVVKMVEDIKKTPALEIYGAAGFEAQTLPPEAAPAGTASLADAQESSAARKTQQRQGASCQSGGMDLDSLLRKAFGFESFRLYQKAVCEDVTKGHDVLLVMPTGAGKSLCYQLPGVARGGTTLVISPLIALMEDQVHKARALGLRAETIHSGMTSEASRRVCRAYMEGELDFLYIAPERLAVPRFVEFLSRHKPVLIAIDEAHCISHWGHDFRPDYRMLGDKLPGFRPVPVIALTATATELVQKDIIAQLGLENVRQHIHGFRRTNIAIEIVEMPQKRRLEIVHQLLADAGARPAVVYAPTRKMAESAAEDLESAYRAAAYHAGFDAQKRSEVQKKFITGECDVIVATTAFGMGIDKADIRSVIHLALPSSIEGYYQEIGRAGRDGKSARAILFYTHEDLRTLDFFHEKNYPETRIINSVFKKIPDSGIFKSALLQDFDPDQLEICLEKLWVHGGIDYRFDEMLLPVSGEWEQKYELQKEHNYNKVREIEHYARRGDKCRMEALLHYFGDNSDGHGKCGICDVCAPDGCRAKGYRKQDAADTSRLIEIRDHLKDAGYQPMGRIYRDIFEDTGMKRHEFDQLIEAMGRAGLLKFREQSFEKDGHTIKYRSVILTPEGKVAAHEQLEALDLVETNWSTAPRKFKSRARQGATSKVAGTGGGERPRPAKTEIISDLEAKLKEWRAGQAKKMKVPAFCIFPDKVLTSIVAEKPRSEGDLLNISGIGLAKVARFGKSILEIVNGET